MCSDEPDINPLYGEFNDHYKPMVVSADIEHVMLVANIVNAIEIAFHIRKIGPFGFSHRFQPRL
jgi:hypothetical protein